MNATDEFAKRIARAMQAVPDLVAEEAVEYFRRRFTEKAIDGRPWRPVSPHYHPRRGTLMVRSGELLNSIRVASVNPRRVVIAAGNSKVPYARVHNEGFTGSVTVRPHSRRKKGQVQQVRAHSRRMNVPRRQFLGRSAELENILKREVENLFKSVLS